MSHTWTPSELKSEAGTAAGKAWRVVEHQHTHATRKLVDTQEEQQLLEQILDQSKPTYPAEVEHFDYLLKTPFRYLPVNRYGSRFRRAMSRAGVFYASQHRATALAETAFYRIRFFAQSESPLLPRPRAQLTVFTIKYSTSEQLDLTVPPLSADADEWMDLSSYHATQALSDSAREANIQVIRYTSVRDPHQRDNIAIMNPAAFDCTAPIDRQTWYFYLSPAEAHFSRAHASSSEDHRTFDRSYFDRMPPFVA